MPLKSRPSSGGLGSSPSEFTGRSNIGLEPSRPLSVLPCRRGARLKPRVSPHRTQGPAMAKQTSFGICQACGARKGKAAMFAHVQDCMPAQLKAGSRAPEPLLLLKAEARGLPTFWLHVAVKRDGKLKDVDRFLRRIWLECCGHMSEFSTRTQQKISMNTRVSDALGLRDQLDYVYDFGQVPDSCSACWVVSTLHLKISSGSPRAMSRQPGLVMRAARPRQPCARSASTRGKGSAARRMHQPTNAAMKCYRRWSIHRVWVFAGTPVRPVRFAADGGPPGRPKGLHKKGRA